MLISCMNSDGRGCMALAGWRIREPDYPFNRKRAARLYYSALIRQHKEKYLPIPRAFIRCSITGELVGWNDDDLDVNV